MCAAIGRPGSAPSSRPRVQPPYPTDSADGLRRVGQNLRRCARSETRINVGRNCGRPEAPPRASGDRRAVGQRLGLDAVERFGARGSRRSPAARRTTWRTVRHPAAMTSRASVRRRAQVGDRLSPADREMLEHGADRTCAMVAAGTPRGAVLSPSSRMTSKPSRPESPSSSRIEVADRVAGDRRRSSRNRGRGATPGHRRTLPPPIDAAPPCSRCR